MNNRSMRPDPGKQNQETDHLRAAIGDAITHELRTPLTSIKASVTALLTNSRLQRSQRNDLLTVIDEEADRLNQLVGEAVETARLETGVKLDLKRHALEEIISAARNECRTLLAGRSISVQLQQALPAVRADIRLARKALTQLLENAIKYSPVDQPISLTAELMGKFVRTSVADRCRGIDGPEQTRIFEKFYRGKHHRHSIQGTGMGLPIATAIIKAHGGSLCVTSRLGHGCVFSFTLPIDQQL